MEPISVWIAWAFPMEQLSLTYVVYVMVMTPHARIVQELLMD